MMLLLFPTNVERSVEVVMTNTTMATTGTVATTATTATWSLLDRESVEALQRILVDSRSLPAPASVAVVALQLRAAWIDEDEPAPVAGLLGELDPAQLSDSGLLIVAAASVVDPAWSGAGEIDPDDLVAISALDTADWLQIVVNGCKRGAGQYFMAEDFLDWIEDDVVTDDLEAIERGLAWLDTMWRSIGLIDDEDRLTEVGEWVLPRALCHAWGASFD
jgi:hypothetical protein